jgi:histidinol phosphatase-like PHP family hydrolase
MEKDPFFNSAERRRKRAEEGGGLSLSHWRGEFHAHTKTDPDGDALPKEIIENRKGSNCGKVPLEVLVNYHARKMQNDYLAITEHSRDASPEKALKGICAWFKGMYMNDADWLRQRFNKDAKDLSEKDLEEIEKLSEEDAHGLVEYGDERILEIYKGIDDLKKEDIGDFKVLKGVEISLLPDGSFDSDIIKNSQLEFVNCSIHPEVDPERFKNLINDPKKYSDLVVKGIEAPRVNNIGHVAYGCPEDFAESLDWKKIAQKAIEHKVSLEINLKKLMDHIYKEMLDYKKYPKNDKSYLEAFRTKLPELIPIISSAGIRGELAEYFSSGLMIALNTDEHNNPYARGGKKISGGDEYEFPDIDFRFWRCLKEVEIYFNEIFNDAGIKKENILNALTNNDLRKFIGKNQL